jgi:hydrogenase maturation protease
MSAPESKLGSEAELSMPEGRSIAVLGLGNSICSDDRAGIEALRLLGNDPRLPPGINLIDGGILGLAVVGLIENASRVLILDAVDTGTEPGTVVCISGTELERLRGGSSLHDLKIPDLISMLRLMGKAPQEIVLLGIQPASVSPGACFSPAVAAGLNDLVLRSLRLLSEWSTKTGSAKRSLQKE